MKKFIKIMTVLLTIGILFTGCSNSNNSENSQGDVNTEQDGGKISGTVSVNGSTTILPVAQSIADDFTSVQPDISVEIQGTGSSVGIKSVYDKSADIGAASRELKEEEKSWGLTEHIIAYDGIAIAIHPSNPITNLDKDSVKKIFSGEVTNWKDVGGNDSEIIVISREEGSGTRDAFKEILGIDDFVSNALISNSNGAVKTTLSSKENGIAYISLGIVDDTVKAIDIDDIKPTIDTIKSGEYKVSRPLLMLTNGELSKATQSYLDFVLSEEGQKIVSEHYISVK